MRSKFDNDKFLEETFAKWLDDNFYEELAKRELILGWYRVNGEKLQKEGKDTIIITNAGNEVVIDDKATLHYINNDIQNFAFELKNQSSGARGWLINNNLKTEYYLLAWPSDNDKIISSEDFLYSDVMIIGKNDILKLLTDNKIDISNIDAFISENIKRVNERSNKVEIAPGISFNVNYSLAERPINIVIKRDKLVEKAILNATIGMPRCDKCGKPMLLREGKYGQFYGCSNYPDCKNTKPYIEIDNSMLEKTFK